MKGVRFVVVDMCAYGAPFKKPTGFLTNAPWVWTAAKRCEDAPPHTHQTLEGRVWSFKENKEVWLTSEAAEYHSGFCECWAESCRDFWENKMTDEEGCDKRYRSKKEIREEENEASLGGMRNPNKAVAKLAGWRNLASGLRRALSEAVSAHPEIFQVLDDIRAEKELSDDVVAKCLTPVAEAAAAALAKELGGSCDWEKKGPTGWRTELIRRITEVAEDPDVDIADWLGGNTPLGINKEIPSRGVYPKSDETEAQRASFLFYEARKMDTHDDGVIVKNYKSFDEAGDFAKEELHRLLEEGHLKHIGNWKTTKGKWKEALATKLAVLVKEKEDGSVKTRFIVDMRRSGVNGIVKVYERIVLPRGTDLVNSVLDLWEHCSSQIELCVIDVTDAFLNLKVDEEESAYVIVTDNLGQYYCYSGVPFGLASAPLLWGRVAAWLGRAAQAIAEPQKARLQIYVDDPVIAVAGSKDVRDHSLALILVFWISCGARLAWKKAALGPTVKWIGATYKVCKKGIRAFIDKARLKDLENKAVAILEEKGITFDLRSFTGEMSWVAGIVPRLRPFVSMLYASMHAWDLQEQGKEPGKKKRPTGAHFVSMARQPLLWILEWLRGQRSGMRRQYWLSDRHATVGFLLRTDASTSGMGAVLTTAWGQPVAWWADIIRKEDVTRLSIEIGNPAFMTEVELLAVLISLRVWGSTYLFNQRAAFILQMDSESALRVTAKLASPVPTVNAIAAEVALALEEFNLEELQGRHFRNVLNIEADALSRLTEGKKVPGALKGIKMTSVPTRDQMYKLH